MCSRLIAIGDEVFEEFGADSPNGSRFLLNKTGRRIELLEHQLATERAELARLEAEAVALTAAGSTQPSPPS
jgi:hypothetical protein